MQKLSEQTRMNRNIGYGLGMVVIAATAVFLLQPNDRPNSQGHSMTPPDTTTIAQGDPIVTVTLPAALTANAQDRKSVV